MTTASPTPAERLATVEKNLADALKRISQVEATLGRVSAAFGGASTGGSSKPEADDAELDGRFSDRSVRKDPKRWAGASFKGASYSQCPSEYLLVLADYLEWGADMDARKSEPPKHNNGTPYFEYARKDARLARGWARRNHGKKFNPPAPPPSDDFSDDSGGGETAPSYEGDETEIPF